MVDVIDQEGNLFGRVNVVDAIVGLLLLAILVAGVAVAFPLPTSASTTTTITAEATVSPAVADAIASIDSAPASGVESVGEVSVEQTILVNATEFQDRKVRRQVVRFDVTLSTSQVQDHPHYRGTRLYVGQAVELDLRWTVVTATVVGMEGSR